MCLIEFCKKKIFHFYFKKKEWTPLLIDFFFFTKKVPLKQPPPPPRPHVFGGKFFIPSVDKVDKIDIVVKVENFYSTDYNTGKPRF